jgi:hypothetical protein
LFSSIHLPVLLELWESVGLKTRPAIMPRSPLIILSIKYTRKKIKLPNRRRQLIDREEEWERGLNLLDRTISV